MRTLRVLSGCDNTHIIPAGPCGHRPFRLQCQVNTVSAESRNRMVRVRIPVIWGKPKNLRRITVRVSGSGPLAGPLRPNFRPVTARAGHEL